MKKILYRIKEHWFMMVLKTSWRNMVDNRRAFWFLMLGMCLQNLIYFSSWALIFKRVSSLNGWALPDVAFLTASTCFGYGLIFTLFGGIATLGECIENGELDIHLARPRSTLLLACSSRMNPNHIGDILTGLVALPLFMQLDMRSIALFIILALSSGMVFLAFRLFVHSLYFFGAGGETGENSFMSFIIAASNPQKGLSPFLKFAMLSIFPAGFVGLLPVEIMHGFRWDYMAYQLCGSVVWLAFSLWFFQHGLKRYSSGNKFLLLR